MDAQTKQVEQVEYLSPSEAGDLIGRSTATILRWVRKRKLSGVRVICGRYLIPKKSVLSMVEELDAEGPPPRSEGTRTVLARHGLE